MKQQLKRFLSKSPLDYYRFLKNRISVKKNIRDKENVRNYLKENSIHKLQIGTGSNEKEGWLNTDLNPKSKNIVKLDASKHFPFDDNTFDFIYCEHIFEHLKFEESCNFLRETFRTLKPNGIIRISVPHLDFLIELYLNPTEKIHKDYNKWVTEKFYPYVSDFYKSKGIKEYSNIYQISQFFKKWGHQYIHTFESLQELLELHDFTNITRKEIGSSDFSELCDMEQHGTQITDRFNELESMVLEAQKK